MAGTTLDDRKVPTADLVRQIRIHRGRWTIRALLRGMGYGQTKKNMHTLRNLCARYELPYASMGGGDGWESGRRVLHVRETAVAMTIAQNMLRAEIEKAHSERAMAPLYRGGDLEW